MMRSLAAILVAAALGVIVLAGTLGWNTAPVIAWRYRNAPGALHARVHDLERKAEARPFATALFRIGLRLASDKDPWTRALSSRDLSCEALPDSLSQEDARELRRTLLRLLADTAASAPGRTVCEEVALRLECRECDLYRTGGRPATQVAPRHARMPPDLELELVRLWRERLEAELASTEPHHRK